MGIEVLKKKKVVPWELNLGANPKADGTTTFKVWAPHHLALRLELEGKPSFPMQRDDKGYFSCVLEGSLAGERYVYLFENGLRRPDPVSRLLPKGVHGPTEIVDAGRFSFTDQEWQGLPLRSLIFYELHVGTFTPEGTFEGAIQKLDYLKELGITCIEIMPIAQFPGKWNWGYDGVSIFAAFDGYGGYEGFKKLVNACHERGIAVCLDVVYNHLGPEGNYLQEFAPYFADAYHTPWGKAFNYDGAYSDEVRSYIIQNALFWLVECHVDCLRLDAIHGIYDFSASPMLGELMESVREVEGDLGRGLHIVAESDLNDVKSVRPTSLGGSHLSALWNDDFHHALHVTLTGEQQTYYRDFNGIEHLAKALKAGFVYDGVYSPFRKKKHGNAFHQELAEKLIVFAQNHDQIGNRPLGERLTALVEKNALKLAACLSIMTPYLPLLFMGEEFGEKAPFEYFVDYADHQLMRAIYEGRKREFQREEMPFPGKESFQNSRLSWTQDTELFELYKALIQLRKTYPPNKSLTPEKLHVDYSTGDKWLSWVYPLENEGNIGVICFFGDKEPLTLSSEVLGKAGEWERVLSTRLVEQKTGTEWILPCETCLIVKQTPSVSR